MCECPGVSLSLAVTVSVSLSLYDTVSVSPSIFLPSLSLRSALLCARLHLSARVIEPCALSLSAKRLADRLHFHAEGREDSVAAVRVIDWDPSQPSPSGKLLLSVFLLAGPADRVLLDEDETHCAVKHPQILHFSLLRLHVSRLFE